MINASSYITVPVGTKSHPLWSARMEWHSSKDSSTINSRWKCFEEILNQDSDVKDDTTEAITWNPRRTNLQIRKLMKRPWKTLTRRRTTKHVVLMESQLKFITNPTLLLGKSGNMTNSQWLERCQNHYIKGIILEPRVLVFCMAKSLLYSRKKMDWNCKNYCSITLLSITG